MKSKKRTDKRTNNFIERLVNYRSFQIRVSTISPIGGINDSSKKGKNLFTRMRKNKPKKCSMKLKQFKKEN